LERLVVEGRMLFGGIPWMRNLKVAARKKEG